MSRRWFPLLAALLMVSIGLVAAEVFTRALFRYNTPDTVRENTLQYASAVYARHLLVPNQRIDVDAAWGLRAAQETSGREFHINALGYRGPDATPTKPPGRCRIVIVGGSAVFDTWATEGNDWPRLTEKRLHELGRRQVEVINAGIPGHSSADAAGRLYTQLWMYEPDFVLLYNAWNDIKYFSTLSPERPLIAETRSYAPAEDPFQRYRGTLDWLLSSSQLYVKLRTRYFRTKYDVGSEGLQEGGDLADSFPEWGVEQYRIDLAAFVAAAHHAGAIPVMLTQATLAVSGASESDRERIAYEYVGLDHDTLVRAFDSCTESMRTIAKKEDVLLLDVAASLSGRSELFRDHVHATAEGSRALARLTADFLAPLVAGCP